MILGWSDISADRAEGAIENREHSPTTESTITASREGFAIPYSFQKAGAPPVAAPRHETILT
jgi:hypothetical protein